MSGLSHDKLLSIIYYDMCSGVFVWKVQKARRIKPGQIVGANHKLGYQTTRIDGKSYKLHRLAWFYHHGIWPKGDIDHIDGNTSNNAIYNLRDCTTAENVRNRRPNRTSKISAKGVDFHHDRFRARISVNGRCYYLGHFKTLEEASSAYAAAAIKLHGEFARIQ